MSDRYKDSRQDVVGSLSTEEAPSIDPTDDFDPFSGVIECVEEIDIALNAPPESQ